MCSLTGTTKFLEDTSALGVQVVIQLLELGVSLDCLRIGGKDLSVGFAWNCPVGNVLAAVRHVVRRGQPLAPLGRVIMALYYNSCLYFQYSADGNDEATKDFGET